MSERVRPRLVEDPGDALPDWQRASPRSLTAADRRRFIQRLGELLLALGLPPGQPGTTRTAARLFDALVEATDGYEGDPRALTLFPGERAASDGGRADQIVEGPIAFEALCEHHALPFFGEAWVGYVARDEIIGISKLTRIVRLFARRFTVQERLANEIGQTVEALLDADGAAILLRATHTCTRSRGVRENGTRTVTVAWRGRYERDASLRAEFLALLPHDVHE